MWIKLLLGIALAFPLVLSSPAHARQTHGQDMSSPSMRTFGGAKSPAGFSEFCNRHKGHCGGAGKSRVVLSPRREAEMRQVNSLVNSRIRPVADMVLHNRAEKWSYPVDNKGDCEDYALLKRRMLIEKGWPASALLMTVVTNHRGEGHAVLTVVTDRGDFILDNERSSIKLWNKTGYYYFKRQSSSNPRAWVALRSVSNAKLAQAGKNGR